MNKEYPLVSIIIPTYDRPKYLKRCVDSIINQTYDNIEIIIVDDNNPNTDAREETKRVVNEIRRYYDVNYIEHESNKNGSAARNTGWKAAKGNYITYVDDDDELLPTKIEKQIELLERLDQSWVACYTAYKIMVPGKQTQVSSESRQGDCYLYALMRTMYMGSGSNLLIRKCIVDKIGGYDESFIRNQDIEFLVRVVELGKLAYVAEPLLLIHQDGKRVHRTFEQIESYTNHYLSVFKTKIDNLEKNDRERVIAVISLERFRIALYDHKVISGIKILISNKVKFVYIVNYIIYLVRRFLTHKSYGFDGSLRGA